MKKERLFLGVQEGFRKAEPWRMDRLSQGEKKGLPKCCRLGGGGGHRGWTWGEWSFS